MKYAVDVYWSGEALLTLAVNQSSTQLHIRELADSGFLINQRGQSHVVYVMERAGDLRLSVDGITCVFSQEYDPSVLRCPNSGKLARYLVQCGDHVVPGQTYAEMEVMKMYLPLVVAEAGVITRLVKAVGSVVQNGDALGYMKIDDLSKVKKAERFTSTLPKEESADETAHPQFTIANALTILHSFLSGYWIAEGQARQCLDSILTATQDASLPFYEYMDVLSTMESVLPEDLKQQLNDVLFAESGANVENKTEEQVVESVLGAEEAQPFSQQFPARRIRQVLTEYLLRSANRLQLQKEMEPLFAVTAKYRDGLLGYRASLLFELLDGFIASQRTYATLHSNSESRRSSDSYGEQVWQSEFSHQHLAAQGRAHGLRAQPPGASRDLDGGGGRAVCRGAADAGVPARPGCLPQRADAGGAPAPAPAQAALPRGGAERAARRAEGHRRCRRTGPRERVRPLHRQGRRHPTAPSGRPR